MCCDSSFVGTEEEIAKENELQYILRIDRLIGAIAKSKCWISVVVMEDYYVCHTSSPFLMV